MKGEAPEAKVDVKAPEVKVEAPKVEESHGAGWFGWFTSKPEVKVDEPEVIICIFCLQIFRKALSFLDLKPINQ